MTTMDDDQQPVTDDGTPPKDAPGASDAPDEDLDALLEGLGDESKPAPAAEPKGDDLAAELKALKTQMADDRQADMRERAGRAMTDAISRIQASDDSLNGIPVDILEGFLLKKAQDNPSLGVAFGQQFADPGKWAKIEKALSKELIEKFSAIPSPKSTEDREAAEAAARGVSNTAPTQDTSIKPQADLTTMNDAEYAAYKATLPAGAS